MNRIPASLRAVTLLALVAAGAPATPKFTAVAGTVALYQFDEGSGTSAADSSGVLPAHSGTLWGAGWGVPDATWELPGYMSDAALRLDVDYAWMDVSPAIDIGPADWTIQAWTRFPLTMGDDGINTLTWGSDGSHVTVSGGILGVWQGGFKSSGFAVDGLRGWHLLSAVGSGTTTTFYIDAAQVGVPAPAKVTSPIQIIGNRGLFYPWESWGVIDSLRILNVARSPAEIAVDGAVPPPDAPASPGQFSGGDSPILVGGAASNGFKVKAMVNGDDPLHRLQVEVKPVDVAFDGSTGLFNGADVADGPAEAAVGGLAAGAYHWQVRAVDSNGASPWVGFGSNLDAPLPAETDVVLVEVVNSAPTASSPAQRRGSDGSPLGIGQKVHDAGGVRFEVSAADIDVDPVRLEIEIAPAGAPFQDLATVESGPVGSGQTAGCAAFIHAGAYRWQYRVVDSKGAAIAWTSFGGNGTSADFVVEGVGSSNRAMCLTSSTTRIAGAGISWIWIALAAAAGGIAGRRGSR